MDKTELKSIKCAWKDTYGELVSRHIADMVTQVMSWEYLRDDKFIIHDEGAFNKEEIWNMFVSDDGKKSLLKKIKDMRIMKMDIVEEINILYDLRVDKADQEVHLVEMLKSVDVAFNTIEDHVKHGAFTSINDMTSYE